MILDLSISAAPSAPPREPDAQERFEQSALATARALARKIIAQFKSGELKTWDDVAKCTHEAVPEQLVKLPLTLTFLSTLLEHWVRNAPARAKREAERFEAERQAATSKRKYAECEVILPKGLKLYPQQEKAVGAALDVLYKQGKRGVLIPLGTGKGKSWIAAAIAKWLQDNHPQQFVGKLSVIPSILIITKRTVVLDFRDVLAMLAIKNIGVDVAVWSYQEVSSKRNAALFQETKIDVFGQPTTCYRFSLPDEYAPGLIIFDECQDLKKMTSKKARYLSAFAECKNTKFIFTSATPAVTLQDTMFMSLCMGIDYMGAPVTRDTFTSFIRALNVNSPVPTNKPNATAMKRWAMSIGERYISPPNDPSKVKAFNRVHFFDIIDERDRLILTQAMNNYRKACANKGKVVSPEGEVMVTFMVMARAAELASVNTWVLDAIEKHRAGYAPVLVFRFLESFKDFIMKFCESAYAIEHGITADHISRIWGGSKEIRPEDLLDENQYAEINTKYQELLMSNATYVDDEGNIKALKPTADNLGVSSALMLRWKKTMKYHGERVFRGMTEELFKERNAKLSAMRLHGQSQKERQQEKKRFLDGATQMCCYTLAAGGTGISLDHRYQHTRPRWVISTMTYWAEEFAQALGRCVRITTLTNTTQEIYIPRGTILETHMAPSLAKKLKSIDAIGSSNVDLAAELEKAMAKFEAVERLDEQALKGYESDGVVEVDDDEDDEDDDSATE